ncbi:MAG: Hsp70 family protein [Clostridiales bacterium]|jgi:molecular chaperone DnaK|nr:Hsp70 family protein [Clostridiales bacterium]
MIVGIDLGTSTSEIAYINSQGQPEPIPIEGESFIMPSVVHINEHGIPEVGTDAKEKLLTEPESTFQEVKRLFGQGKKLTARGQEYTPAKISSFILSHLVKRAEEHLGEKVDRAVITVPAYFTDKQRKETLEAGELAGLKVERIINEPTAAALEYGLANMKSTKNVLVYDLGGGTLDVTVLELFEGVCDVKSSCGNNALGGKDFDELIMKHLVKIHSDKRKPIPVTEPRVANNLKRQAEICKKALSEAETYKVEMPFLKDRRGGTISVNETITRKEFEKLIGPLVSSTSEQIKTALGDAGLEKKDIDLVLLVGGSTRIPLVKAFLKEELDFEPETFVDPDLAVVKGAAIQAGIIDGVFKEEIVLSDVCPYTLSTEVLDSYGSMTYCDTLIPRNTTIPTKQTKTYQTAHDNQVIVRISAFQGEGEFPAENYLLGAFELKGLPPGPKGSVDVDVTFEYDLNGVLKVYAKASNGIDNQMKVSISGQDDKETPDIPDVIESKINDWKKAPGADKYKSIINRAEARLSEASDEDDGEIVTELRSAMEDLKLGILEQWDNKELESLKAEVLDLISDLS